MKNRCTEVITAAYVYLGLGCYV